APVHLDRRRPVPGLPQGPRPGVLDRYVDDAGKHRGEGPPQPCNVLGSSGPGLGTCNPKTLWYAPAPDRDPTVVRTLCVDGGVCDITQHLLATPTDLFPLFGRKGFGDDHRRTHRHPRASRTPQACGEPFGGAQDVIGTDGTVLGDDLGACGPGAGKDLLDRRVLEEIDTQ